MTITVLSDHAADQMQEREARPSVSRTERNQDRLWASNTHEVELDRQGRMPIPGRLRECAGLHENVLVTGAINRVELWDPGRWDEKVGPEAERLSEGFDE